MPISETWTIPGAENLPIHGNTHTPNTPPRACVLVIHGWTGHKDRNITPAVAAFLADEANILTHRITLSHAGVEKDADDITRLDEFERDSNAFCVHDVRALVQAIHDGTIPGKGLPLILLGHSRGGATIYRCAAEAETEGGGGGGWPIKPAALISLSATATLTRLTDEMRTQLETVGHVTRECGRAPGGIVRMGRSWYQHHLDEPDKDHFAESIAAIRCPTLIAHGQDDSSVPPSHATVIADLFKDHNPHITPQLAMIPNADHNYNVAGYQPDHNNMFNPTARKLYDAIKSFLTKSA